MHMVSKKDFNSAELETMRISNNPTTAMTANGKVQTREEATISDASRRYTGSSFTRKALRRSWENPPLDQWSKTTSHQQWQQNQLQKSELRTVCGSSRPTSSSTSSSPDSSTSSSQEFCDWHGKSSHRTKWAYESRVTGKPVARISRNRTHK